MDIAAGVSSDSPTPMNRRAAATCTNPAAAPVAAVSALHSARPAAISRGRCRRSASEPANSPNSA
jgi:hypothetical protein